MLQFGSAIIIIVAVVLLVVTAVALAATVLNNLAHILGIPRSFLVAVVAGPYISKAV